MSTVVKPVQIVLTYSLLIGLDIPSKCGPGSIERDVFENLLDSTLLMENLRSRIGLIIVEEKKKIDRVLRGDLYRSVLPSRDYAEELRSHMNVLKVVIGQCHAWFLLAKKIRILDENIVMSMSV
jgi:hypothetical protein